MTTDMRCRLLAQEVLKASLSVDRVRRLGKAIADAIEDWLDENPAPERKPGSPEWHEAREQAESDDV